MMGTIGGPYTAGSRTVADAADGRYDIVGQYEAFVVVPHIDAELARRILPTEFELMTPAGTPAGKHPAMYSFGKHRHVHPRALELFEYDYDEALIGLPFVGLRKDGRLEGPFFHMTAVRLNNEAANTIGVALGFPKKLATIENQDLRYAISMRSTRILEASMRLKGRKFKDDLPNFEVISPLMRQRVISRTPNPFGRIIVTTFSIDTASAFMVPATLELQAFDDSLPGLPKGTHSFDTIEKTAFGGAYLSIHTWRLAQPPVNVF